MNVLRLPELVRSSFDEGHVIGMHSLTHARSRAVSLTGTVHIDASVRAIRDVLGCTPPSTGPHGDGSLPGRPSG
jgi:peptidoglycan/xylan/chitin deacetylase (PgdA/CDA1 family)